MKKTITIIAVMLLFISISATAQTAYITEWNGSVVSVIDVGTNTVSASIVVGNNPSGVSVSQDGTKVYVANHQDNSVSVINTATNAVIATIAVGNYPIGLCVSPDGSKVYVANAGSNTVSVINTTTNSVSFTIPIVSVGVGITITPDGSKVYVTNNDTINGKVSEINTSTNTVSATISVGAGPQGISVTPDGSKVYVANGWSNSVSVINTSTNTVSATITVGSGPTGISVIPDGSKVYVTNQYTNDVSVINTATNIIANTITVGTIPTGVSVTPDGSIVYVVNIGSDNVSVINTTTNIVTVTIPNLYGAGLIGNFISTFSCISPTLPSINASSSSNCGTQNTILSITTGTLNNATNWQWYSGSCGGVSVGSGTSITVSPTSTTTYYVRGEGGCVTPDSCRSITITVNQLPTATITPNGVTTFCHGDSVILTASANSSYLWSNNATTQSIIASSSGDYSVIVTGGNGCSATSLPTSVTVNSLPTLTVSALNSVFCINWASASLLALPTGGTWSGSGISGNSFVPDSAGVGIHPIVYSYTDSNGCSNTDTLKMTVNACTGINEIENNNDIIVYPNPANFTLNIHLSSYTTNETIYITNVLGREVYAQTFYQSNNTIDVSNWNSGVYFYQIKNYKETIIGKFVIQK